MFFSRAGRARRPKRSGTAARTLVVHRLGHHHPTGRGQRLDAGGHVDALAIDAPRLMHHVARVHADPKLHQAWSAARRDSPRHHAPGSRPRPPPQPTDSDTPRAGRRPQGRSPARPTARINGRIRAWWDFSASTSPPRPPHEPRVPAMSAERIAASRRPCVGSPPRLRQGRGGLDPGDETVAAFRDRLDIGPACGRHRPGPGAA
jgi:hypothetical protein